MRTYLQSYLSNQESQRTNLEYSKDTNPNGFIVNGLVDINRLQNYIAGDMMQQLDSSQRFFNKIGSKLVVGTVLIKQDVMFPRSENQ